MSENQEIIVTKSYTPVAAKIRTDHENYKVTIGNNAIILKRDVDFGKYGKANRPSLLKSGAEKLLCMVGVETRFVIEKAVEDFGQEDKPPFFFYRVRCELYKDGVHITDGFGSANTNESACGRAVKYDLANQRLKLARKRAMIDATLMITSLSGAFYADLEDSTLDQVEVKDAASSVMKPNATINQKQIKRLFTLCSRNSVDTNTANEIIAKYGYQSSKDIQNKDYDSICNEIESHGIVDVEYSET